MTTPTREQVNASLARMTDERLDLAKLAQEALYELDAEEGSDAETVLHSVDNMLTDLIELLGREHGAL